MLQVAWPRPHHCGRVWPRVRDAHARFETCQKQLQSALRLQHPGLSKRTFASLLSRPEGIKLRPYQEESIQSVLEHLKNGEKRLGISLATGSGKTVIFSHLLDRIPPPTELATQTLILAHRKELVYQAARHCRELYPDRSVEVDMGARHATGTADITVASVMSMRSPGRLLKYDPARFKLLLVDEAHHIAAKTYLDILSHFELANKDLSKRGHCALVGVSATFSRQDGLSLGEAIDHIVYHKDYVDMIEDKWLADACFTTVHTGADLSKVRSSGGDFQTTSLSKAVNTSATNELTVRSWLEIARERKSTLVFCVDIAHVASLTEAFRAHGIDARFVTSETHSKTRAERITAFKASEYPVLLNCGIFTEGTDIPNIDCVLLARPTQSRNLLVQMIGRGLRNSEGKEDCHVIDMVASLETGIVTVPTLFGLDPQEIVQNFDAEAMKELKEKRDYENETLRQVAAATKNVVSAANDNANVTFTHYDDVNDLISNTSQDRHIRKYSTSAWVGVGEEKYILSDLSGDYITIRKGVKYFEITHTRKTPQFMRADKVGMSPFLRPSQLAIAESLESAVHSADTFASNNFNYAWIQSYALWRRKGASVTQIKFLNRTRDEDKQLKVGDISKGKAADMITKLRHGAKKLASKAKAEKAKALKKEKKDKDLKKRQTRERVKVGPIKANDDDEDG